MLRVTNTLFDTTPAIIHAGGTARYKPVQLWNKIQTAAFTEPEESFGKHPRLTFLTCNNGNPAMGLFERSAAHLGVPVVIGGGNRTPWVNATDKTVTIVELLAAVKTKYVCFSDSRDSMLIRSPGHLLKRYLHAFPASPVVFGAEMVCYPRADVLKRYEDYRPGAEQGPFKYLNAGCWIGPTELARTVFARILALAEATPPMKRFPWSEQGRIRQLFPKLEGSIDLDYKCELFQNNVVFHAQPYVRIEPDSTIASIASN